ncbi:hypothetical protein [Spirosoma koreense]
MNPYLNALWAQIDPLLMVYEEAMASTQRVNAINHDAMQRQENIHQRLEAFNQRCDQLQARIVAEKNR